jgi:hypothetical protein
MSSYTPVFNYSRMRFSGQLQKNTPVDDGNGGQADNFATILTTRCSLDQISGTENALEGNPIIFKTYRLMCRFQSAIVVDTDTRWLINGNFYSIVDCHRVDMIPHLYEMTVTVGQISVH